ncbi:MAG: polyhydroxyalkanoate synthesis regulator DNA-binding domain-containing protein [Bacteroidota bacterium]
MARIIKRYGSRKLYDTTESRYVSLDEVAGFVREGQDVQVVDNKTGADVTAVILTQIISDEGRSGTSLLSSGFLHDLLRMGERVVKAGEEAVEASFVQARRNVDDLARRTVDRIRPAAVSDVQDEMARLRARLDALEATLTDLDSSTPTD